MGTTYYYTANNEMIGEHTLGQSRIDYLTDSLGSIVTTVDQSLTVVSTARYKPYGADLATTGTMPSFGYVGSPGYRRTKLPYSDLYVRARTYATVEGRFTTQVGIEEMLAGEHPYGYAVNNPTTLADPGGLKPHRHRHGIGPHRLPTMGQTGIGPAFSYGAYCGAANVRNPGWHVLPQDCIDSCCLIHDRCIEGNQGAGLSNSDAHKCCDATLGECAQTVIDTGCCQQGSVSDYVNCLDAARQISIAFQHIMGGIMFRPDKSIACVPQNKVLNYSKIWWGNPTVSSPLQCTRSK